MTDKRKDEMPERIYAELNKKDFELPTKVWFSTKGMGTEYIRADLSPPVPDDVAEAVTYLKAVVYQEGFTHSMAKHLENLIRAASTPSPEAQAVSEVTVEELIKVCEEVIYLVKPLPEDVFGYVENIDNELPVCWPIKLELVDRIERAVKGIKIKAGGG